MKSSGFWLPGRNADGRILSNGRVWAPKFVYRKPEATKVFLGGREALVWRGKSFNSRLKQLVSAHWHIKDGAKSIASDRTKEERWRVLKKLFDALRNESPYAIRSPENIDSRHVRWWFSRWEAPVICAGGGMTRLSTATVANELSILRQFCKWIHQPQLIESSQARFHNPSSTRRTHAASRDKSWTGSGIEIEVAIDRVFAIEPWVAVALHLQHAFGARREEAVCFKPKKSWLGDNLVRFMDNSTKGGRPRVVPVLADWEVVVLEAVTEFCKRRGGAHGHVGGVNRDLQQNLRRYNYVLEQCGFTGHGLGVTGHGLRTEFAIRLAQRRGLPVPIRGGDMYAVAATERSISRRVVSEALGHSRERVTTAYYGDPRKPSSQKVDIVEKSDVELLLMARAFMVKVVGLRAERERSRKIEAELKRYG